MTKVALLVARRVVLVGPPSIHRGAGGKAAPALSYHDVRRCSITTTTMMNRDENLLYNKKKNQSSTDNATRTTPRIQSFKSTSFHSTTHTIKNDGNTPPPVPPLSQYANKHKSSRSNIQGPHGRYLEEYDESIQDPVSFWYKASQDLHWFQNPTKDNTLSLQPNSKDEREQQHPGLSHWFADGKINMCYNCLDRHVVATDNSSSSSSRANQNALIYDSPLTNTKQAFTYAQLLQHVSTFAYKLKHDFDVQIGDRVVIYMPMIPQAIIAMLACARIGAIHSVVFGGFASAELSSRIQDCNPKVIISASGGIEPNRIVEYKPLLDDALDMIHQDSNADHTIQHQQQQRHDPKCIIVRRKVINDGQCNMVYGRDVCYDEIMDGQQHAIDAVSLPSNHPNYILYTSGTTGQPKGVLRDTGSHATALKYSMNAFYDTKPGDVFWAASDIGWAVGHSYTVYGPLLQGCTTVLYEGKPVGTPDAGAFYRVIEEYDVKTLFVAPTAIRAIKQADPKGKLVSNYDLANFQNLFLAGERSDPGTLQYCEDVLQEYDVPVIDHWWQTELGWPAIGNAIGLGRIAIKYGACAAPVPGFNLSVFNSDGSSTAPRGTLGNLAIKLPLPPGSLLGLYKNNDRYIKDYLDPIDGYYMTGDSAIIDEEGYVHIMARTDDIINTAGHRLSTGTMEEILLGHSEVADCAVIGVVDNIKGETPVGFVVTNSERAISDEKLITELVHRVRHKLGPVASFKIVAVVPKLPKTRSGKILRGTMKKIANGEDWKVTPTIEDPNIFDSLAPLIRKAVSS